MAIARICLTSAPKPERERAVSFSSDAETHFEHKRHSSSFLQSESGAGVRCSVFPETRPPELCVVRSRISFCEQQSPFQTNTHIYIFVHQINGELPPSSERNWSTDGRNSWIILLSSSAAAQIERTAAACSYTQATHFTFGGCLCSACAPAPLEGERKSWWLRRQQQVTTSTLPFCVFVFISS